jgi:hypothetical protein
MKQYLSIVIIYSVKKTLTTSTCKSIQNLFAYITKPLIFPCCHFNRNEEKSAVHMIQKN